MTTEGPTAVDRSVLARRGVVALVLGVLVNLALAFVLLELDVPRSTEFFQYGPIVFWTTLGVFGATVVYYFVTQRSRTPNRTFARIALGVLVLSFLPDVALAVFVDAVTTSEAVALMSLHVPPAAICIVTLTGWVAWGR